MDAPIATPHPGAMSSLRRVIRRRPVAAFLVMAYAVGWSILLAANYFGLSLRLASSLAVIVGLAPPAFLVTAASDGGAAVRDLLRRCLSWRVSIRWFALALLGLLAATLLVASAFLGAAPLEALVEKWSLFFTVFLPEVLVAVALIQLFEEAAWTGFVQDTLQSRHGPLRASIMVAPAFALFHLPLNILACDLAPTRCSLERSWATRRPSPGSLRGRFPPRLGFWRARRQ